MSEEHIKSSSISGNTTVEEESLISDMDLPYWLMNNLSQCKKHYESIVTPSDFKSEVFSQFSHESDFQITRAVKYTSKPVQVPTLDMEKVCTINSA